MSEQQQLEIIELEIPQKPPYKGFWIYDGQLAGFSDIELIEEEWANGFRLVSVDPTWEESQCYWDGVAVRLKPAQPSPAHYWDGALNEWVFPEMPVLTPLPDPVREAVLLLVAALKTLPETQPIAAQLSAIEGMLE